MIRHLSLLAHKTAPALRSSQKRAHKVVVTVGTKIESKRAIKYLRLIIDDKLNFKEHVKFISEKASITQESMNEDDTKYWRTKSI